METAGNDEENFGDEVGDGLNDDDIDDQDDENDDDGNSSADEDFVDEDVIDEETGVEVQAKAVNFDSDSVSN